MKFLTINQRIREIAARVFASGATGQDSVSTAGTAEALNGGSSQAVPRGAEVAVKALSGNAGTVYVGFDSSVSSSDGFELGPGSSVSMAVSEVSNVYVDADNSGDGVSWITESES